MKHSSSHQIQKALFLFFVLLIFCGTVPVLAAPIRVAILPFDMHAEKDLTFLQEGIMDMLSSRIAYTDQVEVINKNEARSALASVEGFEGESRALLVGGKLKADYVLFGSITMFGESVSIDAKMVDVTSEQPPLPFFAQTRGMGEVIPQINQFATNINETVFGRAAPQRSMAAAPPPPSTAKATASPVQPAPEFNSRMHPEKLLQPTATQGPVVEGPQSNPPPNPLFVAPTTDKSDLGGSAFWKSKNFAAVISAMDIGDVDNDGSLETILAVDNNIEIYRIASQRMQKVAVVKDIPKGIYIGVDAADINGNGFPEIFVSSVSLQHDRFNSFVLEFNGTEFTPILDRVPWLFRVSRPVDSAPILLGQRRNAGNDKGDLFSTPIYKLFWKGSGYEPERQIVKGRIANVIGTTVDDVMNDGVNRILAYSPGDSLRIYDNDGKTVWKGSEEHGGSIVSFTIPTLDASVTNNIQFFPMRLRTADINKDGNVEVIVASNHNITGVMKSLRIYDKSNIISMSWNGLSLSQNWSTTEIDGRIADYLIGDFDNDGNDEIVAVVVLKEKKMIGVKAKSVVIAYDLSASNQ